MSVEVETPEDYAGNDGRPLLTPRSGAGHEEIPGGGGKEIRAKAAVRDVRLLDDPAFDVAGPRHYTMEFSHYAEAPRNVAEEIIHHSKR